MPNDFKIDQYDDLRNFLIRKDGSLISWEDWMKIPVEGVSKTEDADFEIIQPKQLPMSNTTEISNTEPRIIKALVLNNYGEGRNYADMIKEGIKTIETRWKHFTFRGDIVICVGGSSVTENKGLAICVVDYYECRKMLESDVDAACIEWDEDRYSMLLRNWRYFSREFKFSTQAVNKNFQGLFSVAIPDDVKIIPQPQIASYQERKEGKWIDTKTLNQK